MDLNTLGIIVAGVIGGVVAFIAWPSKTEAALGIAIALMALCLVL